MNNQQSTMNISRRKFIQTSGLAAAGLAIGYQFIACTADEPEGTIQLFRMNVDNEAVGAALNPYILIEKTGAVTIFTPKPEIGTGTFQSLPLLIAEELGVNPTSITVKQSRGDNQRFGDQDVGGSSAVSGRWVQLRQVGAAAREMLCTAAAARWGVAAGDCRVENGQVFNQKNESLSFGDLVEDAAKLPVPKEPKLKDPKDFLYIGKPQPRKDIEWKVNGSANFGIDMKVEGMVYAVIERSPNFSGKIKSLDDTAARSVKGVLDVVRTERWLLQRKPQESVAVIADNFWAALKGKKALQIEWEVPAEPMSTEKIYNNFRELAKGDGAKDKSKGNFAKTFAAATVKTEAEYELPFLAHSPLEPQNCLAHVQGDKVEIWSPSQTPNWDVQHVAGFLKIPPENITYHVPFVGGGFGRRLIGDYVIEACRLSKQLGKPVKVMWTREDDTTQGPFRPGSVNQLKGALDADGHLLALHHKVVAPSINYALFNDVESKTKPGYIMEPIADLYDIPNFETSYVFADVEPMPINWWRSVYSSTNAFAHESFIDEMARAGGQDPFEFRRHLLRNDARRLKTLEMLAEKSGWGQPKAEGTGRGVAITHCFGSTAGHVVEVSKNSKGKIKVDRVVTVVDAGIIVNPDNYRAQVEGCIVMALTAALKDAITFENGVAKQDNFHNYRMLRIDEMPKVEIHLMQNTEAPGGAGEPALPPLAPALANAIFDLTGERLRKLPMDLTT
ncbi:MAG: xanthine dehydrogenase family protein molybdopterin-binding subunit [Bacteroidetes bacterium]|nr:xanthine dehydrogenase family protein molybdopterin-binding subunit [Bacteroidota bacterium]